MTLTEIATRGGPVIWILVGYSVTGLALFLERYIHFLRMGRAPRDLEDRLREGPEAALAAQGKKVRGPEAAVIRAITAGRERGITDLVRVGNRIREEELHRMERGLRTLGVLANTAPLLGLLGTVLGMIKAFQVIEAAGGRVDAQALAGGIWEAMLTTGAGLGVAIPLLILLHLLEGEVERRAHNLDKCVSVLVEGEPAAEEPEEPAGHRWEELTNAG